MSDRKPVRLSLVLCSRNDAYMGNSLWRLRASLEYAARRVNELGKGSQVEILVADWGSDTPLRDVLDLTPETARLVSFLHVPAPTAKELQKDSPFAEVFALNAAVRRASGEYIGRIDQDTLVGSKFFERFFSMFETGYAAQAGTKLFFSNQRMVPYRFAVRCLPIEMVEEYVRRGSSRFHLAVSKGVPFYENGVGILLLHRDIWYSCGGYDESMIYMNNMEVDLLRRLQSRYEMVDLGRLVDYSLFHLEHYHPWKPRRSSTHRKVQGPPENQVYFPNGEDWGLGGLDLPILPARASTRVQAHTRRPSLPLITALVSTQLKVDAAYLGAGMVARRVRRLTARLAGG